MVVAAQVYVSKRNRQKFDGVGAISAFQMLVTYCVFYRQWLTDSAVSPRQVTGS